MIERKGHHVHAFNDPILALHYLKEENSKECSIMISDIKMPKMTGIELSKYVKEARPELKFVIMSSMSVRKQEWRQIVPFTKYMDDFVGKPFSIEDRRHDSKVRTGTNRAKRHLTAMPKAISQTTCPQYRKNRKQSEASCLPGLSL